MIVSITVVPARLFCPADDDREKRDSCTRRNFSIAPPPILFFTNGLEIADRPFVTRQFKEDKVDDENPLKGRNTQMGPNLRQWAA